LGYVDALSGILGRCKARAREEGRVVMQRRRMKAEASGRREGKEGERVEDEDEDEVGEEGEEDDDDDGEEKEDSLDDGKADAETPAESEVGEEREEQAEEEVEEDEILVAAEANLSMWLERAARLCLILASQMIEMKV
jgi:hypothetical protein